MAFKSIIDYGCKFTNWLIKKGWVIDEQHMFWTGLIIGMIIGAILGASNNGDSNKWC